MTPKDSTGLVLVRVFSDTNNIGYYSVLHDDQCISLLPIIETTGLRDKPIFMDPYRIIDPCRNVPLITYYKFTKYRINAIHNDPRLDLGFYTEENKPSRLPKKKLKKGDIILFMAGLAQYPPEIWFFDNVNMRKILYNLRKEGKIGVYIVGGLVVERKIEINNSQWNDAISKYPVLTYSPHYYRVEKRNTFAVLGKGFYIDPPIKIAVLTTKGYRLTRKFISLIGYNNAEKLLRQNFRKSRYILVEHDRLEKILFPYTEFY